MMQRVKLSGVAALCVAMLLPASARAADRSQADVEQVVADEVRPLMQRYGVPGMTVGVVVDGHGSVYDFGVESRTTGRPVTDGTLFELGSVSKTFTATLASYAQVTGRLSLSDSASTYLPALRGSALDGVSLLHLGTHTTGGMPLQFPAEVTDDARLMAYYKGWTPSHAPGTVRTYANPSIALLGLIAATSMHADFDGLMERTLFQPLGLRHAYLKVPPAEMGTYAQGYTAKDVPTRMAPGMLASEAYGIRTTAADMLRFVEANMGMVDLPEDLRRAIDLTHTGYYAIGPMTQDLIWEQYRWPAGLEDLLAGNSAKVSYEANPVTKLDPPLPPQADVLINKTGSTNGFASYVAFVPTKKIGIVLLANKNFPIDARIATAHAILTFLNGDSSTIDKPNARE